MFILNNNKLLNPIYTFTLLLVCISVLFPFETSKGADRFTKKSQPSNQEVADLSKGKSFTSGSQSFVHLPELYSIMYRQQNPKINPVNKTAVPFLQKGQYTILKNNSDQQKKWSGSPSPTGAEIFPVALNPRTNKLVVITGKLIIQTYDITDINNLIVDFDLKPTKIFDHLNSFFIERNNFDELLNQVEILKKDPRIKRVDIEVIENIKKPL